MIICVCVCLFYGPKNDGFPFGLPVFIGYPQKQSAPLGSSLLRMALLRRGPCWWDKLIFQGSLFFFAIRSFLSTSNQQQEFGLQRALAVPLALF